MRRESLQLLPGIAAVGITQIIGWGSTFHLPGVLGETIAADLGFTLTIALLGPTVMLVTLAGVSWFLSGSFERYGARAQLTDAQLHKLTCIAQAGGFWERDQ